MESPVFVEPGWPSMGVCVLGNSQGIPRLVQLIQGISRLHRSLRDRQKLHETGLGQERLRPLGSSGGIVGGLLLWSKRFEDVRGQGAGQSLLTLTMQVRYDRHT